MQELCHIEPSWLYMSGSKRRCCPPTESMYVSKYVVGQFTVHCGGHQCSFIQLQMAGLTFFFRFARTGFWSSACYFFPPKRSAWLDIDSLHLSLLFSQQIRNQWLTKHTSIALKEWTLQLYQSMTDFEMHKLESLHCSLRSL